MRSLLTAAVLCVAIGLLAGCGSGGDHDVQQAAHEPLPIDTTYVLPDAVCAFVINVRQLCESPTWDNNERLQMMGDSIGFAYELHPEVFDGDLRPSNIAQLMITAGPPSDPDSYDPSVAFVLKLATPHSGRRLVEAYAKNELGTNEILESEQRGRRYYHIKPANTFVSPTFVHFPDDNIVVVTQTETDMQHLLDNAGGVKNELTDAMLSLNTAYDINFVALNNEHTNLMFKLYWDGVAFGVLPDLPDQVDKVVMAGSLPPRAEYTAVLTFEEENEAAKFQREIKRAVANGVAFVDKRIEETTSLPDDEFEKRGLPDLKCFLENLRTERSGAELRFHVNDINQIDLYSMNDAIQALRWNSVSKDNGTSKDDHSYGFYSDEESSAAPPIADDSAKIEATIDRRVQYHIDHLTDEKYKTLGPEIRASFCEALGSRGARAKAAIPTLEKVAAEDDDESVREAAKKALEQIQTDLDE